MFRFLRMLCVIDESNSTLTSLFLWECHDSLTPSSPVQPPFTPSAFWCGCSVCSPAPAVCSLPFNNLPLAKSLSGWGRLCFTPGGEKHATSSVPCRPRSCCRLQEIRCDLQPAFFSSQSTTRWNLSVCHMFEVFTLLIASVLLKTK